MKNLYFRVNIYNNTVCNEHDYFNFGIREVNAVYDEWVEQRKIYPEPDYEVSIYLMRDARSETCYADDMIDDITPLVADKNDFKKWLKNNLPSYKK